MDSAIAFLALSILILTLIRIFSMLFLRFILLPRHRARNRRHKYDGAVAVIVPAFNEEENVESTIRSLLANTKQPDQIVVVDDGSKDRTGEKVMALRDQYPDIITLVQVENGGKARALNIGIAYARPEIVICIDGDTILDRHAIKNMVRHFDDPKVGVVAGKVMPANARRMLEKFQFMEYMIGQNIEKEVFGALNSVGVVPGAIGAWRKELIREIDGYPEDTIVEDQDLTLSVLARGYTIEYEDDAIAYTEAPDSVRGFVKQRVRWVFGTLQCFWKYRRYLGSIKHPGLGLVVLPNILLFNTILPLLTPIIDIFALKTIVQGGGMLALQTFVAFTILDMMYAAFGIACDQKPRYRLLSVVVFQRVFYRYMMSYVVIVSLHKAIAGTIAPKSKWTPPVRKGYAREKFDGVVRPEDQQVVLPGVANVAS